MVLLHEIMMILPGLIFFNVSMTFTETPLRGGSMITTPGFSISARSSESRSPSITLTLSAKLMFFMMPAMRMDSGSFSIICMRLNSDARKKDMAPTPAYRSQTTSHRSKGSSAITLLNIFSAISLLTWKNVLGAILYMALPKYMSRYSLPESSTFSLPKSRLPRSGFTFM